MFTPIPLNLPAYPFQLIENNQSLYIFDQIRKRKLLLTPEEWVRQHFVQFLINQKMYPKSLIKLEGGLKINQKQNRTDIVVYNQNAQPFILIECKAPLININQKVFDQAAHYNLIYKVTYLVVSNGLKHYACKMDYTNASYQFIDELPDFETLKAI